MSYPLSMSLGAEARGETGKWYQRDAVATLNGTWSFRPVLPATYRRVPAHKGGNATFMANEGTKEQRMCNFKDFNTSALSQTKWRDITKGHDWTEFSKGMLAMQKQKIAKDFDSLSKVIRQRVNNGRLLNANVEIYKERLYYELRYEYTERFEENSFPVTAMETQIFFKEGVLQVTCNAFSSAFDWRVDREFQSIFRKTSIRN